MLESFTMIFIIRFSLQGREKSKNNTVVFKAIVNCSVQAACISVYCGNMLRFVGCKGVVRVIDWMVQRQTIRWSLAYMMVIRNQHLWREHEESRTGQGEKLNCKASLIVSPQPGRELWRKNCPSELSCIWLNLLGLYIPSLIIHWMWAAQEEAWSRARGLFLNPWRGWLHFLHLGSRSFPEGRHGQGISVFHSVVGKTYPNATYHSMGNIQ